MICKHLVKTSTSNIQLTEKGENGPDYTKLQYLLCPTMQDLILSRRWADILPSKTLSSENTNS